MEEKKRFYKRGWFTWLMLFVFFPVGVVLLWKYHNKRKLLNVVLSVVFGIFFIGIVSSELDSSEPTQVVSQNRPLQQSQSTANNNSGNKDPATQSDIVEPVSSEEPTETDSGQTELDHSQYDTNELLRLFNTYYNNKSKSDKDKLQQSSEEELYDIVISVITTNQNREDITMDSFLDNDTLNYVKKVCDTYLDIFDSGATSDKIRELREYALKIISFASEADELVRKYQSDDGNLLTDTEKDIYTMDFYIQNSIGVQASSAIDKFLLDMGIYENKMPPSYGATSDFQELYGTYFPGSEQCVVQPLSEYTFSQAGMYTLNVIYSGEIEVVDVQGFKSFVPLYVEVSDEFIDQLLIDANRLSDIDEEWSISEQLIKSLLAV